MIPILIGTRKQQQLTRTVTQVQAVLGSGAVSPNAQSVKCDNAKVVWVRDVFNNWQRVILWGNDGVAGQPQAVHMLTED